MGKNHRRWDDHLPALLYAYNTVKHEATGFTPAYVNQGRELAGPHKDERGRAAAADPPDRTRRRLAELHELVRINLARGFQRQERHYNLRRRDRRPQVGDQVWKREHPLSSKEHAFNAKLAPRFVGPLKIRRIISPVVFDLTDVHRKWHRHVRIKDIKKNATPDSDTETVPPTAPGDHP